MYSRIAGYGGNLTDAGIEVVHWSMVGDPVAIDRVVMSYAQTHGYIVFTKDLDFRTLLAIAKSRLPSVVQVRNQDLLPAAISDVVISALRQVQEQLESGALVTIDRSRLRIRILPID